MVEASPDDGAILLGSPSESAGGQQNHWQPIKIRFTGLITFPLEPKIYQRDSWLILDSLTFMSSDASSSAIQHYLTHPKSEAIAGHRHPSYPLIINMRFSFFCSCEDAVHTRQNKPVTARQISLYSTVYELDWSGAGTDASSDRISPEKSNEVQFLNTSSYRSVWFE